MHHPQTTARTDDEMEQRGRQNFSDTAWGEEIPTPPGKEISCGSPVADSEQILDMVFNCDQDEPLPDLYQERHHVPPAHPHLDPERSAGPARETLDAMHKYRLANDLSYLREHDPEAYFEGWKVKERARNRSEYAEMRADMGHVVRGYKIHDHGPTLQESWEDRKNRQHRNRQRSYRNVDAETVRARQDLSTMSVEEKADHKRQQAAKRQQTKRNKVMVLKVLEDLNID